MMLYGYWRSSSTWRVRIAMHLKSVDHEERGVCLLTGEQNGPVNLARNPMGQVPALVLPGGAVLTQSVAIIEWLEERFDGTALLPSGALERARVRQLVQVVNAQIQPLQNLSVRHRVADLGGSGQVWGRRAIEQGLDALELMVDGPGPWLSSGALSMAELFVVPQLYNARRFNLSISRWPRLEEAERAAMRLPAFIETHPDNLSNSIALPILSQIDDTASTREGATQ